MSGRLISDELGRRAMRSASVSLLISGASRLSVDAALSAHATAHYTAR